ncbi:chorismate mutase [Streptomyces umbrinus]|uniref:chorismate mutase n=1 Tax=Streptomyces umbrinus TaxID=67370 RepID=UPI0019B3911A|nr:chorismate mutase [Streptomyces umbrinus]MCR3730753.1 chorismate mutase [Streptomyces umbrinus]GHH38059.1 chorismate mutase [Streptomyces umbrinus]
MRPHRLRSTLITALMLATATVSGATSATAHTSTAPASATAASSLGALTELFAERLLLADKVAAAKYGTESPIDDPARERQILDDVAARAAGLGLDPDSVTAVFRDQIEANKLVQRGLYARWDAHPDERPTERPDLAKEVRPALDLITTRLLAALQETAPVRADASCEPRLYAAATLSAYGHRLDVLHLRGLGRALPSVCGTD